MKASTTVILSLVLATSVSCGKAGKPPAVASQPHLVTFDSNVLASPSWRVGPLSSIARSIAVDATANAALRFTWAPGETETQPLTATQTLDGKRYAGARVTVTVDARSNSEATVASVTVSAFPLHDASEPNKIVYVTKHRMTVGKAPVTLTAILDVPPDATRVEIDLAMEKPGTVWFDDLAIERSVVADREIRPLSQTEIARLSETIQLLGLIRYFHPSDEAAHADWDLLVPTILDDVLAMRSDHEYTLVIDKVLAALAPTAEINESSASPPHSTVSTSTSTARWIHVGHGTETPYLSFREGIGNEPKTSISVTAPVDIAAVKGCRTIEAELLGQRSGTGTARVLLNGRKADGTHARSSEVASAGNATARLAGDGPIGSLDVGVSFSGYGELQVFELRMQCDGKALGLVDLTAPGVTIDGFGDTLYEAESVQCGSRMCRRLTRTRPAPFHSKRDMHTFHLGDGRIVNLPLAVSVEGERTIPATSRPIVTRNYEYLDRPSRLGAIAVAWSTVAYFFPFHDIAKTDWAQRLAPALQEAAVARNEAELVASLQRLTRPLRDNHVTIRAERIPRDGILPIMMRRFGDQLVVVGTLPAYADLVPVGARITEINGVDARVAYDELVSLISSATPGWERFVVPFYLATGHTGRFARLTVLTPSSRAPREVVLSYLDRDVFDPLVREKRPATGTELAPGVIYVDLEALDATRWKALLATGTLQKSKTIIYDVRGYITNVAFDILSHHSTKTLSSPLFAMPIVEARGIQRFDETRWTVRPSHVQLTAKPIFVADGRSGSADETLLQIVRDHRLGLIVGEPTAGTNGNIASERLPGGLVLMFSGMRTLDAAGNVTHMRPIVPDVPKSPTLGGIARGNDEVLDAAVATALSQ